MVRVSLSEQRGRSERGAVAIITALVAMVLFVVAALVVDLGLARDTRRQSQNAADSASLAAANVLYGNTLKPDFAAAVAAAKTYSAQNFGITAADWSACTDPEALRYQPTTTACISFQNAASSVLDVSKPDTIRVRVPVRELSSTFGGAAGVSKVPIRAESEASLNTRTEPVCVFCVLGASSHSLQNGDLSVSGGMAHFNGSVSSSTGSVVSSDRAISIQGLWAGNGAGISPAPLINQPAVADPLAFMAMPETLPVYGTLSAKSDPCTQGPGFYGSYNFNSSCTLSPGLYVIGGASTWAVGGNTVVTGNNVTLYFRCGTAAVPGACTSPTAGSRLTVGGGGTFNVRAPTTGDLKGLLFVYDRKNTSLMELKGNSAGLMQGTVYALSSLLTMSGDACLGAVRSQFVINDLSMNGNPACLHTTYMLDQNVDLPPADLRLTR